MTLSGTAALRRLKEGNCRFSDPTQGDPPAEYPLQSFSDLSAGQNPFAAVVACSDSRVPVEAVFSQGAGALFVVRVAGNVMGPQLLGSLEFAVEELGVPLILVVGHTDCGAISAALASFAERESAAKAGTRNIDSVLEPISRVISRRGNLHDPFRLPTPEDTVRLNVEATCREMTLQSEVLTSRASSGQVQISGSVYDLKTGRVKFLGEGGQKPDVP